MAASQESAITFVPDLPTRLCRLYECSRVAVVPAAYGLYSARRMDNAGAVHTVFGVVYAIEGPISSRKTRSPHQPEHSSPPNHVTAGTAPHGDSARIQIEGSQLSGFGVRLAAAGVETLSESQTC